MTTTPSIPELPTPAPRNIVGPGALFTNLSAAGDFVHSVANTMSVGHGLKAAQVSVWSAQEKESETKIKDYEFDLRGKVAKREIQIQKWEKEKAELEVSIIEMEEAKIGGKSLEMSKDEVKNLQFQIDAYKSEQPVLSDKRD